MVTHTFCVARVRLEPLRVSSTDTMTTVVPTSEEDAALSVVRFASELAWADAGPEVFPFLSPKPLLFVFLLCCNCKRFGVMLRYDIMANVNCLWDLKLNLSLWDTVTSDGELKYLGCVRTRSVLSFYVVEVSEIRVHVWKMKGWEWLSNC